MQFITSFWFAKPEPIAIILLGSLFIIIIVDSYRIDKHDGQPGFGKKKVFDQNEVIFFLSLLLLLLVAAAYHCCMWQCTYGECIPPNYEARVIKIKPYVSTIRTEVRYADQFDCSDNRRHLHDTKPFPFECLDVVCCCFISLISFI